MIYLLIAFFALLIIYQTFLEYFYETPIIQELEIIQEGMDNKYQNYNMNDPNNVMILAQQNAGNIQFLKEQLDSLLGLNQQVKDISGNVVLLQQQVNDIVIAQQNYATQMTPKTTPNISGIETTDINPF
jgi:hypothetical protein